MPQHPNNLPPLGLCTACLADRKTAEAAGAPPQELPGPNGNVFAQQVGVPG